MIPEREREALMRLTMCARKECGMCKYKRTCNFEFQYEISTKNMNVLADALREDEPRCHKPQSSYYRCFCEEKEEQSYCAGCEFWYTDSEVL